MDMETAIALARLQPGPKRHLVKRAARAVGHAFRATGRAVWTDMEDYGALMAGEVDPVSGLGWLGARDERMATDADVTTSDAKLAALAADSRRHLGAIISQERGPAGEAIGHHPVYDPAELTAEERAELQMLNCNDAPRYGVDERGPYWEDSWGNRRDADPA